MLKANYPTSPGRALLLVITLTFLILTGCGQKEAQKDNSNAVPTPDSTSISTLNQMIRKIRLTQSCSHAGQKSMLAARITLKHLMIRQLH